MSRSKRRVCVAPAPARGRTYAMRQHGCRPLIHRWSFPLRLLGVSRLGASWITLQLRAPDIPNFCSSPAEPGELPFWLARRALRSATRANFHACNRLPSPLCLRSSRRGSLVCRNRGDSGPAFQLCHRRSRVANSGRLARLSPAVSPANKSPQASNNFALTLAYNDF